MQNQEQVFSTEWLGRTLTFKTGKLAKQANSAVIVQYGETVILATVVESQQERDVDFFPLMVDFEERLYAAGIIKGSQWVKREGRPTDDGILTGRMIDRSVRPLFDETSRKEVQVILTVLSVDKENDHDIVSLVAASAALSISGVKWDGPISGIRVGRVENKLIFNPTYEEMEKSDLDLIVAGTQEKTIMIEAGAKEVADQEVAEAIKQGQKELQGALNLIKELKQACPVKFNNQTPLLQDPEEIEKIQEKEVLLSKAKEWLKDNVKSVLFNKEHYTKGERKTAVKEIKNNLDKYLFDQGIKKDLRQFVIKKQVEKAVDTEITNALVNEQKRVDGRALDEIRNLSAEVKLLPRNHGAGLFSRGETQIMSVVTLGSAGLEQTIEGMEGTSKKRYMHHYNFPPFSVGEARFMRGPGRREIGHGSLAEKAVESVIPTKDEFPYTIRVVSETLGSNGSSSMGSTCASILALMDAGVPIKKPVSGIAMGLASNDDMSKWEVLTDIQDLEDGKGGMDFKITGTDKGITAIQLDTKTNGITEEIIDKTFIQGRKALNQILEVITSAISEPRKELSIYAPKISSFRINPEKIRSVIGPGGKVINGLIAKHGVEIDIEDDGLVMVCGVDAVETAKAVKYIKSITHEFKPGEIFQGTVSRLFNFGVMVEVLPGNEGLVHVSELAPYRISSPENFLKEGESVFVQVKEIDDQGRVNLTMKGLTENEKLWEAKKGEDKGGSGNRSFNNRPNNGGGRDGGRNNRSNFRR